MRRSGFTLVELLVVVAVIGVLAGGILILVNPVAQLAKSRDAGRKSSLAQLRSALENYLALNGRYPTTGWVNSTAGSNWLPGLVSIGEFKTMPLDPKNTANGPNCCPWTATTNYAYYYLANSYYDGAGGGPACGANPTNFYLLTIHLEQSNDPQAGNIITIGNGGAGCTYGRPGWITVSSKSGP